MRKLIMIALMLAPIASNACEFTSLRVKVKVESRTLNYEKHKEVIKTEGSSKAQVVKSETNDYSVFSISGDSFKLDGLSIREKYDYYTTTVYTAVDFKGEVLKSILKEVVGEKKINKRADLKKYFDQIDPEQALHLDSSYYAFHGSYYGETEDETFDQLIITDPDNKDNKLLIGFNFKRIPKCK